MRTALVIGAAVVLVIALVTVGWALLKPKSSTDPDVVAAPSATTGTVDPTTTAPPTTTAAATPTPTKKATTKPKPPTNKPKALPPPPPPAAQAPPAPNCEQYPGPDASAADVKAALTAAAGRHFWDGVVPPAGADALGATAAIKQVAVPTNLIYAIAFTESSWKSSATNTCDVGQGIGLMQLMPQTASDMNARFGESYDRTKMADNANLGAMYLEWLIVYFGLYYYGGSFDLDGTTTLTDDGQPLKLRNVVIAAYNAGAGTMENLHGTPNDGSDDTISIPSGSQWYLSKVTGYMLSKDWETLL
jgi:soluble lytic murein transglycosylase-like protein